MLFLVPNETVGSVGHVEIKPSAKYMLPSEKLGVKRKVPVVSHSPAKASKPTSTPSFKTDQGTDMRPVGNIGSVIPQFGTMPDGRPICPICHMTFSVLSAAKNHFQSKHTGASFKCTTCQKEFNRKDILKRHLISTHQLDSDVAKLMAEKAATTL